MRGGVPSQWSWLQLRVSTKCRESTAKACANKCRTFQHKEPAQALHALAGTRYLPTQACWQTHKRREGTRMQVQRTRKQEGHAVQVPGQAKCDPREWWRMARRSADWASGRGSWPKTWTCFRTCQAHTRFPGLWLQNVSARAIFSDRLCNSEMVEEGPHGRTRTSSCVLQPCHVARRYRSAHVSAGRASALGHFSLPSSHHLHELQCDGGVTFLI